MKNVGVMFKAIPLLYAICWLPCDCAETWTPLFNGRNLDGWRKLGGDATYAVEDGAIVGTAKMKTPNTFLCTEKEYGDFILEYEFSLVPRMNSGVQIRSNVYPQPVSDQWRNKAWPVPAKRFHGYQIEIDDGPPKNRWWTAGIYDEGRRQWLFPGLLGGEANAFTSQGDQVVKKEGWNQVRIEAIGGAIRTYLNGVARASIDDHMTLKGLIGLQVHSIEDPSMNGATVRWRNLRIREISKQEPNAISEEERALGWKLLWNGKTLEGWKQTDGGSWAIRDGELHLKRLKSAKNKADLMTNEAFSDFELQADIRLDEGGESAVICFVDDKQSQLNEKKTELKCLVTTSQQGKKSGSLAGLLPAVQEVNVTPRTWNYVRILSQGKQLAFWINGIKTMECERG